MINIYEQGKTHSIETLGDEFKKIFLKFFPKSLVIITYDERFGTTMSVKFLLAKDKSEATGGILENDPMKTIFHVDLRGSVDNTNVIDDKISLSIYTAPGFLVKAPPEVNLVYTRVKVPFRKVTGPPDKILKAFHDYISKLHAEIVKHLPDIKVPFDIYDKFPKYRPKGGRRIW